MRAAVVLALAGGLVAGCGLVLIEDFRAAPVAPAPDGAGADGDPPLDQTSPPPDAPPDGGGGGDAPSDAPADAAADACGPLVFADDFSTGIDGTVWATFGPAAAASADGGTGPYVTVMPPGTQFQAAGIVTKAVFPMSLFVATFRFRVDGVANAADGFAFAWYDRANGALGPASSGGGLGIASGTGGWAFALDAYQNTGGGTPNDPAAPYYGLLHLDPAKTAGSYDWHVKVGPQLPLAVYGAWHDATLTNAKGGDLTIAVDGATVLAQKPVTLASPGAVGFVAGTGGAPGGPIAAYVDQFRLETPNPACPNAFP